MRKRKSSHGFEVSRYEFGVRKFRTFPDRQSAKRWAAEAIVAPGHACTVGAAWQCYKGDRWLRLAPSTRKLYEVFWRLYFPPIAAVDLCRLDAPLLRGWLGGFSLSAGSEARVVGLLKAIVANARIYKLVEASCTVGSTGRPAFPIRESRMLSGQEISRLRSVCWSAESLARFNCALWTGMRRGELAAMLWRWVDWDRRVVRVPASVEAGFIAKGRTPREIPLPPECYEMLADRARCRRFVPEARVFPGANWLRWARRLSVKAGLVFRWHLLRHTYISRLLLDGVPPRVVRELSGHASMRMLERYSHVGEGVLDLVGSAVARWEQRWDGGSTSNSPR